MSFMFRNDRTIAITQRFFYSPFILKFFFVVNHIAM